MRSKLFCAAILSAFVFTPYTRITAQANVTENQSVYLYVDQKAGQDSNPGTQAAPFKTIQAAVNKALGSGGGGSGSGGGGGLGSGGGGLISHADGLGSGGGGVKIIVNPGVYRETVTISNYGSGGGTLTLQAAQTGTAIISGSNVLTGWSWVSSSIFSHPWNYYLNSCSSPANWPPNLAPVSLRAEMLFVNGVPLTQVMKRSDLQPGTFYIDDLGGTVYLSPPYLTDMSSAYIEAAVRPQDLTITGSSNVVLRGLVFRHAASCILGTAVSIYGSSNILVDWALAMWNNWGGFGVFSSTYITLQHSAANYNGGIGFQGDRDQYVLLNWNDSQYNNWRGAQAALYDWGMGGVKFLQTHNATVQNHRSFRNQAQGLWFDTDNKNIVINNVLLAENVLAALQIERSEGPITLENSELCSSGGGINLLSSSNFTITNNLFYNNGGTNRWQAELFAGGPQGGYSVFDWVTGAYYHIYDSNMTLTGNTFDDASPGQYVFATYLSGYDWNQFATTLNAAGNTWYDPMTTQAFKITNNKLVTLSGWQSATGTDYGSSWGPPWVSPTTACALPSPSYADFSISLDNREYPMTSGAAVVTIRIASFGAGSVNLSATGLPQGVTGRFSTNGVQSGIVTFTVTASGSSYLGSVPITVWATSGSRVHSAAFLVDVSPGQSTL